MGSGQTQLGRAAWADARGGARADRRHGCRSCPVERRHLARLRLHLPRGGRRSRCRQWDSPPRSSPPARASCSSTGSSSPPCTRCRSPTRPTSSTSSSSSAPPAWSVASVHAGGARSSARRRWPQQLRRANVDLERLNREQAEAAAVAVRLARTEQQVHALEETDRLRAELLANVSHELRTPLATILTGTSGLLDDPASRGAKRREVREHRRRGRAPGPACVGHARHGQDRRTRTAAQPRRGGRPRRRRGRGRAPRPRLAGAQRHC